jgi:hypothetical protein
MFSTWVYVSTSLLGQNTDAEIANIRTTAEVRNKTLELTGVLIFSGVRFAQFLEGPDEKLNIMKETILRDGRHTDIHTLMATGIEQRRYGRWVLAYSGRATAIDRVLSDAVRERDVTELLHYMDHLVTEID